MGREQKRWKSDGKSEKGRMKTKSVFVFRCLLVPIDDEVIELGQRSFAIGRTIKTGESRKHQACMSAVKPHV